MNEQGGHPRRLLFYGVRPSHYVDLLRGELDGVTVESVDDAGEVLSQLSGGGPDCLVYAPAAADGTDSAGRTVTPADARSFLSAVDERRPPVPVVVVADGNSHLASAVVAHGVDGFVPTGVEDVGSLLAETVEHVVAVSDPPATVEHEATDRALLDDIFESLPIHLFLKDREGRHVRISGAFVDDPESFVGKTDRELDVVSDEHGQRAYEDDMRVVETGEPLVDVVEHLPKFGQWNLTSKVPWRAADGTIVGLIGVSWDITERVERTEELRRQNERLEEFASAVSHDLRNPLSIAVGQLYAAQSDADSTDRIARAIDALERMNDIIGDVLALATHGVTVVDPDPVALEDVAEMAWAEVTGTGGTLVVGDLPTVLGEESHLRRLFTNLFQNALTHGGPEVTVGVEWFGDGFAVVDDGPGIPPDEREDVFQRGYTTADDGTGFGLAIVDTIVDAHGWSVDLTESEAGGARFEITGVETVDDEQDE